MPTSEPHDQDLVVRAAAGDAAAVAELYLRHAGAAHRAAAAVAPNAHDAADAVSEAFARVLTAMRAGRLGPPVRFRAYLVTASRHAALDLARLADRTRPTGQLEDLDRAASGPQPLDVVLEAADAAVVGAAFRSLPGRWREVLWLLDVDGLAPRQAARLLGLSPNGTSQLAMRARAALRSRYHQVRLDSPARA